VKPKLFAFVLCAALMGQVRPLNSASLQGTKNGAEPVVVIFQKVHGHMAFTVNSRPVDDPLRALGIQIEQRGEDCPVIVLVDSNLPLKDLDEPELLANKAGFKNIRSFVFDSERRDYFWEVKFGRGIPFTTDPVKIERELAAEHKVQ
jgi:hypothetical protein